MVGLPRVRALALAFAAAAAFAGCSARSAAPLDGGLADRGAADGAAPADGDLALAVDRAAAPPDGPLPGYTLFHLAAADAVLVDMAGSEVHTWRLRGLPVKMLPGGDLMGSDGLRRGTQEATELLQVSWSDQRVWSFANWDDDGTGTMMSRQHHDYQREGSTVGYYAPGQAPLTAGKTLILAHKTKLVPSISAKPLLDDAIYEVDWSGALTGFEWHAADHFAELGFDEAAVAEIQQDPNFMPLRGVGDWLHINSIATLGKNRWYEEAGDERFHPDNIIVCSREASFVAIISRASGAIVWRLGPEMGTSPIGQLVGPHHAHLIPAGLPGAGNVLLFDNGGEAGYGGADGLARYSRQYSRVLELDPVAQQVVWQYGAASGEEHFLSVVVSSAQRLPNGNTLVTVGSKGTLFEVTQAKQVVWRLAPAADAVVKQIYRAYRIPPQWLPAGENVAGYAPW